MKMSQRTRILILVALLVAAVAVWYSLFFAGKQSQQELATETTVTIPRKNENVAAAKPVAVTTSARALQVLPIPFLVTEAPEEVPLETSEKQVAGTLASTNVPPNPFVPLHIKTAAVPEKPELVPESKKPVVVTPEAELTPNIPVPKTITPENGTVTPPPVTLGKGTLPIKLSPLDKEVAGEEPLSQAIAENQPEESANNSEQTEETTEGETQEVTQPEEPPPPPPNPLEVWANQENLKLDGVALGPVGVAIFKTASGYLALPVGQTFPNKNVLVKTITAERVLLVDGSGTNTLTLELGGGE